MVAKPSHPFRYADTPRSVGQLFEDAIALWLASWRASLPAALLYGLAGMLPMLGGGGYLSQNDGRLIVGLGDRPAAERVVVSWPDGRTDRYDRLDAAYPWLLREGEGAVADPRAGGS